MKTITGSMRNYIYCAITLFKSLLCAFELSHEISNLLRDSTVKILTFSPHLEPITEELHNLIYIERRFITLISNQVDFFVEISNKNPYGRRRQLPNPNISELTSRRFSHQSTVLLTIPLSNNGLFDVSRIRNFYEYGIDAIILFCATKPSALSTFSVVTKFLEAPLIIAYPFTNSAFMACLSCKGAHWEMDSIITGRIQAPLIKLNLKNLQSVINIRSLHVKYHHNLHAFTPSSRSTPKKNDIKVCSEGIIEPLTLNYAKYVFNSNSCFVTIFHRIFNCTQLECIDMLRRSFSKQSTEVIKNYEENVEQQLHMSAFHFKFIGLKYSIFVSPESSFKKYVSLGSLLRPFKSEIWLIIVAATVILSLIFYLGRKLKTVKMSVSLLTVLLWPLDNLLEKGTNGANIQSRVTILPLLIWPFVGIVLRTTYTAGVYSYISSRPLPTIPSNIEEVANHTEYDIITSSSNYVLLYVNKVAWIREKLATLGNINEGIKRISQNAFVNGSRVFEFSGPPPKLILKSFAYISAVDSTDNLPDGQFIKKDMSIEFAIMKFGNKVRNKWKPVNLNTMYGDVNWNKTGKLKVLIHGFTSNIHKTTKELTKKQYMIATESPQTESKDSSGLRLWRLRTSAKKWSTSH
ncbi:unnamed protein product [Orchesella dallaii]|uniref:Uncharacterized protein n=1 Tax=Orchesella dallaii TaxID=48710 RepID=A0ABP1QKG3_9HEXA